MVDQAICTLEGIVVTGKQIGRTIGFPTANLSIITEYPHLDHGVYGVIGFINQKQYYGVMNIGLRPTFNDYPKISYEVHLFDFDKNIYNEEIKVIVCFYIRSEISFPNINQLIKQIHQDINLVKERFGLLGKFMDGAIIKDTEVILN